jgi:hypothetical protein
MEQWERKIGDPSLWNAVICDRRFNYTLRAQHVQDYRPSYKHDFIMKVLNVAIKRIDQHFEKVRPDAVIGLNAVTMYDYLYYLIAGARKIPYFQLKLTRIRNYVSLYTHPLEISPHIGEKILRYIAEPQQLEKKHELLNETVDFVRHAQESSLTYEGAIKKGKGKAKGAKEGAVSASKTAIFTRLMNIVVNRQIDQHYPSARQSLFYSKIVKPIRKKFIQHVVFENQDSAWKLNRHQFRYAVYPLNTEPEVALLVYGRTYRNQIETVRNIASSLPVGWKLVVKEHPNALGYRTRRFYEKLREIPNVILLGPNVNTNRLVREADLLFVVFGTIGLEAIMNKIPVITFCETPYGSFPPNMVRYVRQLTDLGAEIKDLVESYRFDDWALYSYIAAHIESSVRVNLFTGLLGKSGRVSADTEYTIDQQYKRLANYTLERIREEKCRNLRGI